MKNTWFYRAAGIGLLFIALQFAAVPTVVAQFGGRAAREFRVALHKAGIIEKIVSGEMEVPGQDEAADILAGTPDELYAYVVTGGNVEITKGAPVYFDGVAIVRPGTRVFGARCFRTTRTSSPPIAMGNMSVSFTTTHTEYGDIVPVEIDMEPGKFYALRAQGLGLNLNNYKISAAEMTDGRAIDRARGKAQDIIANPGDYMTWVVTAEDYDGYLAWWQAHRGLLDGSWASADGRTEIRFAGDRFEAYATQSMQGRTTYACGTYMFDEGTIILQTDSVKTTMLAAIRNRPGREDVNIEKIAEMLCYRLAGDGIEILARTQNTVFPFGGEFRKRPAGEAVAPVPVGAGAAGDATASGRASLDITWQVVDGVLTVSGRGDVPGNPSWSSAIDKFTAAVIGDGITSLGHHAFAMSRITSIVLGKDVASLKGYALFNCKDLVTVEVRSPVPPAVGSFAFMSTPVDRARLIVPAGAKAAYEKDRDWRKFGTIEER